MGIWLELFLALFLSSAFSWWLIPIAWKLKLVDQPCERKLHNGNIPLVGGISVFLSTIIVFYISFDPSEVIILFIIAAACMVTIGVLDDRYDLSVMSRIFSQLLVASVIVFGAGTYIDNIGNLIGTGDINLNFWGMPFTLLAIMAAMNAYNMVDGIDGLLGALATISFIGIALLGITHSQTFTVNAALIIACAIVPFLMRNTGFPVKSARKIFMGDAGSMFIGLAIVWLLALLTAPEHIGDSGESVRPVSVLWLIAVPLMDMFAIMFRRIQKGQSPFRPDREHLHHLFMRAGFSERQALAVISGFASVLVLIGLLLEILIVPEPIVALLFIAMFACYCLMLSRAWRIVSWWRRLAGVERS
ncbi:UDP-N-acetylglucosamine--undecaprenyl-phosphate N-acetylglucosaminephosphotransferase [Pseudidiomarina gelatinasegens]|uniref:UDP-N-acetylglucosamine--undecaprenyl-phosphate N-acetylglucosaminephosphotransferase n=1 Tax=Pseudidiomarina gelatinasegens TaxID=2487740 RepID=UPI003A96ED32